MAGWGGWWGVYVCVCDGDGVWCVGGGSGWW